MTGIWFDFQGKQIEALKPVFFSGSLEDAVNKAQKTLDVDVLVVSHSWALLGSGDRRLLIAMD